MPPQLTDLLRGTSTATMQQIGVVPFLVLLVISLAGSLLASLLYVQFYSSRATGSQVYRAFPLLGLSITAIFVCIQFSLPLSLGLLGALSIVATFKLAFVGLLFALALVALLVQTGGSVLGRHRRDGTLVVTVPAPSAGISPSVITDAVRRHVTSARLESLSHQGESLILSYIFQNLAPEGIDRLQSDLPAAANGVTFHLFLSRPGSV
jgi:hypothetical protein